MRKEVCVKCGRAMQVLFVGATALEYIDAEKTQPYKLWNSDLSGCKDCGHKVIARFADRPASEHFEDDFAQKVDRARDAGSISDTHIDFY